MTDLVIIEEKVVKRCGAEQAECVCIEWADHAGSHVCDCQGSWHYEGGVFVVDAFPGGDEGPFGWVLK